MENLPALEGNLSATVEGQPEVSKSEVSHSFQEKPKVEHFANLEEEDTKSREQRVLQNLQVTEKALLQNPTKNFSQTESKLPENTAIYEKFYQERQLAKQKSKG